MTGTRIATLADAVRQDTRRMTEQALRLRDAAERLRGSDDAPEWFEDVVREQISRCMVAAADLSVAADRLDAHAAALTGGRS